MDAPSPSVQSILSRVEGDLQRGDYKSAETRLSDFLRTKGYDAELMARLGRIAHDMHNPCAAGKYWIVSPANGMEVDEAIQLFIARCGNNPRQVASQVPQYARLKKLEYYPTGVQDRLRTLNLAEAITQKAQEDVRAAGSKRFSEQFVVWFIVLLVGACLLGGCFFCHKVLHVLTEP